MTERNKISKLATDVGAGFAPDLPPREVVSFILDKDGRLNVTTASGEKFTVALRRDLQEDGLIRSGLTGGDFLSNVFPDLYRYGGRIPRGIRFYRRGRIVCGQQIVEFVEAGR